MGYAQIKQRGHGIHTRQYARTFIVEDSSNSRIVYVSVDAGMISHVVKRNVIKELQRKYGETYHMDNVMISGTRELIIGAPLTICDYFYPLKTHTADQRASTCLSCMT